MGLTTNPEAARSSGLRPDGQQNLYCVLSEEERAKGFVRPVRHRYKHLKCGAVTTMGLALCETYARDPKFYGGTFCCNCGTHFRLQEFNRDTGQTEWQFEWYPDGDPVGSDAEEAQEYIASKKSREAQKHVGSGI